MASVLQDWVQELTLMQQSVLLGVVRGPDGVNKYHPSKYVLRWYRRCTLLSAMDKKVIEHSGLEGGGSFTGPAYSMENSNETIPWEERMDEVVSQYIVTLDELPHHF